MKRAGVVGNPVAHSKSPLIHSYWLEKYGIKASYEKIEADDIASFIKRAKDYVGFNVTVPFKTEIMPYADFLSDRAKKAGAVNTVVVRPDGSLYGHNTDGAGFVANVKRAKPSFNIRESVVVLLGTGGAARGVCAALTEAAEIRIVYRTLEKALKIKESVGGNITLVPWKDKEDVLSDADLLANATTLGMNGFDPLEIDLTSLKKTAVVSDLVYAPLKTDLLKQAENKGFTTADGLGMLLEQARPAFKEWFGILPEITDELRMLVL